ncbi:MAG: septation ring formation regulator EzrA, partial [Bacilli bacterium]|nr:septation ring formation regulator EzrA [Bacilli bacterium]
VLALSTLSLSLIIAGGVILFLAAITLFYLLFLRNRALAHQVQDLLRRYKYLHHLLVEQDDQYLKRIEYISQVNLLYVTTYEKYYSRFLHLKDDQDVYAGAKMNDFMEGIENKRYQQIRKEISEFKHFLNEFENDVNKLNSDLLETIRPEEDCNHMLMEAKDQFKRAQETYMAHQSELVILKKSYEAVFKYVDDLFEQFAQLVEKANYEEAINLMPSIQKVLNELDNVNKVMPNLCVLVSREVPQRLTDIESEYKRMSAEAYPLQHIVTPKRVALIREEIEKIARDLKNFIYRDADEKLKKINSEITEYLAAFQKERDNRKTFEEEEAPTYARISKIEKDFIKLCNSIPKLQKVYAMDDEKILMRNQIQNHINRVGVSKRSLETFVHTIGKKQPYSVLLSRALELKNEAAKIEDEMRDFKSYLSSLKEDVENAYELVSKFYYRVRQCEKIVRDMAMSNMQEKYQKKIDEIYQYLEKINTTALSLPIQVQEINDAVNYLNFTGESTLNQIEQEDNLLKLAESAIIYLNKDRAKYPELNTVMVQNEKAFFSGEFEKAYNATTALIKRYSQMEEQ